MTTVLYNTKEDGTPDLFPRNAEMERGLQLSQVVGVYRWSHR